MSRRLSDAAMLRKLRYVARCLDYPSTADACVQDCLDELNRREKARRKKKRAGEVVLSKKDCADLRLLSEHQKAAKR